MEDQPDIRLLIAISLGRDARLEPAGEASSASEALSILESVPPDVIILDHGIEGDVMGLEAAPLLKAKAPDAKILLFTAFDMRVEADAEPAVDAYLRKDRFQLLLPTVQRLLGFDPDL